jgi:hypothetical protein
MLLAARAAPLLGPPQAMPVPLLLPLLLSACSGAPKGPASACVSVLLPSLMPCLATSDARLLSAFARLGCGARFCTPPPLGLRTAAATCMQTQQQL